MITRTLIVKNHAGIHTRPAALIAKVASKYSSSLHFIKGTMDVNGKSVMGIITLGSPYKDELEMICDGTDELELAQAIEALFNNRFEEVTT